MIINTNAKINLTLDIVGKRSDGYHLLRSVMHPIPLYDTLEFSKADSGISIECNLPYIPTDQRNLVYKAADLFFNTTKINAGISVSLEKRIPVGAGLGGGSANAAGTLLALNELYNQGLSTPELCAMSARLGADVPFFCKNTTQLAEGIGEILSPLPHLPPCKIVLIMPNFSVNTQWAYKNLHLDGVICQTDSMITALDEQDINAAAMALNNNMECTVAQKFPQILAYKQALMDNGALGALMSGSGSTVFGIFPKSAHIPDLIKIFPECTYKIL